jgi:predicted peroxiredoxin
VVRMSISIPMPDDMSSKDTEMHEFGIIDAALLLAKGVFRRISAVRMSISKPLSDDMSSKGIEML